MRILTTLAGLPVATASAMAARARGGADRSKSLAVSRADVGAIRTNSGSAGPCVTS